MKPLLLSWWVLCGADATTTHYNLQHGQIEQVIHSQNPYVIDGVILAEAVVGTWSVQTVQKHHPKLAKGLAIGLVASRGFVVARNLRPIVRPR